MQASRWALWTLVVAAAFLSTAAGKAQSVGASEATRRVASALQNVTDLVRPGRVGYATVWDGNVYVQCRRLAIGDLRCEAAGSAMQPSLAHILTEARRERLAALGWIVDSSFGNHVQVFPPDRSVDADATDILQVLTTAYGAEPSRLAVQSAWVADGPCPPRNGASQNLAGLISDASDMQATVVTDCSYAPDPPPPRAAAAKELVLLYGREVSAEIQRLRVNSSRPVHAVFGAGIGYVQCLPEPPDALYCEAQSAESWPALTALLTPSRVASLHRAGYDDPGFSQNYARRYRWADVTDEALATEILTILHDAYNYTGSTRLEVSTE